MKNYFNFEFYGWINKVRFGATKNGIRFMRFQVVNGQDFIFMHCFEDFSCKYDHINLNDWVKIKGDVICKKDGSGYFFKPTKIELITPGVKKDAEPSSDKDMKEFQENES